MVAGVPRPRDEEGEGFVTRIQPLILAALATFVLMPLAACSDDGGSASTAMPTMTPPPAFAGVASDAPSVLTGAAPDERQSATIQVAAAADLRTAMTEHSEEIEAACETDITWVFGSSGQLTTQIAAGASFGLLLSADIQFPLDLERQELLVPNGVASYSVGRIVILTRNGLPPVTQLSDLDRPDIRKIAIANPDHAPYGRAAKQALESAAMYEVIQDRLVLGENIRQATDYLEQGNADAGIVALALVIKGPPGEWTLIDAELHQPLEQGGGVVKGTGAELTGRCVLQFLLDPRGQTLLREYGFEPVAAR